MVKNEESQYNVSQSLRYTQTNLENLGIWESSDTLGDNQASTCLSSGLFSQGVFKDILPAENEDDGS